MSDIWTRWPRWGELWCGDERICRFNPAGTVPGHGVYLTSGGVEGWDTLPDAKVSLTERGQGDGAHDIGAADIIYSARTVTVHYQVLGDDRADVIAMMRRISKAAHRPARLRMVDGGEDTYVEGYIDQMQRDSIWNPMLENGLSFHFVCPRPERRSWQAQTAQLFPTRTGEEGLFFGNAVDGKCPGLVLGHSSPRSGGMQYGGKTYLDSRNRCVLTNKGSSRAYPVFTVIGPFLHGVRLRFTSGELDYRRPVAHGARVVLDCRTRTATADGSDASQWLRVRRFPTVPPGGSLSCVLATSGQGSGSVLCQSRDTYM